MKQKITVIVLLCVLVGSIVGASFLYESLKDSTSGAQLATPGGNDERPGNNDQTSDSNNGENSADSGNNGSTDDSTSSGGNQSGADHDHTDEGGDHGALIKAYDFSVYDASGNKVKLSDFFGKPIVLNFWASWCGPCRSEMPDFDEVYRLLGDEVVFMLVNLTDGEVETMQSASAFIDSMGYSFPIYFDLTGNAAYLYGIRSIPTTFFISARGNFVAYAEGALDYETLLYGISMIYN
jgi:thiol-disulfide isomerase/thioredoxin